MHGGRSIEKGIVTNEFVLFSKETTRVKFLFLHVRRICSRAFDSLELWWFYLVLLGETELEFYIN